MRLAQRARVSTSPSDSTKRRRSSSSVATVLVGAAAPGSAKIIFWRLAPRRFSTIGTRRGSSRSGLKTWNSSGSTMPWTTVSPSPQAPVTSTVRGNPVSVSIENITPEEARSERTMRCTPTESATFMWSKPWFSR